MFNLECALREWGLPHDLSKHFASQIYTWKREEAKRQMLAAKVEHFALTHYIMDHRYDACTTKYILLSELLGNRCWCNQCAHCVFDELVAHLVHARISLYYECLFCKNGQLADCVS